MRYQNIADITIYHATPTYSPQHSFEASRKREIDGLLERGIFRITHKNDIPEGTWIFGSRFVDKIKHEGTERAFKKSRLVVQAYKDSGKRDILTQAPTIQRVSQRLILAITMVIPHKMDIYLRDISQAYTQSMTNLARDFYIHAPTEMGLEPGTILQVVSPLYGMPEAGMHWYKTYHDHHLNSLQMTPSTFDPCLLFNKHATAIIGMQTDDMLISATNEFMVKEEEELQKAKFLAKPREKLTANHPLEFNGFVITQSDNKISITQPEQIKKLNPLPTETFTKDQYIAERARGAYIATISQPQAAFSLSFAAQTTQPTADDTKFLNRCLDQQQNNEGLTFVELDLQTLRVVAFTDSSFANNHDHSSQIGYVIILADAHNNANIIHWQSIKCRRITRSVLASELYALSLGFDTASTIKSTLDQILACLRQGNIPLTICIDSKSLYERLVKLGP